MYTIQYIPNYVMNYRYYCFSDIIMFHVIEHDIICTPEFPLRSRTYVLLCFRNKDENVNGHYQQQA